MFASDNNAPVAPEIMRAIEQANEGDAVSYGGDSYTARAIERFREVFGVGADPYLVFTGTGANVIALSCLLKPYEAVIAPASAHLHTDECGALERFVGCKILPVPASNGKLDVEALRPYAEKPPDPHFVQPRVISISQSTEFGTLYTPTQVQELCEFAHGQGWYVHMDGARISNAAAALRMGLRECTRDLGVDVLTFGGTKNGLMYGEAIVFFDQSLHRGAAMFARKQAMHLSSKMRFIAAQFLALLEDERWMRYASHANEMARRLEMRVRAIPGVRVTRPAQCNAVFATLDRAVISKLQEQYFFYIFDDALPEVRWMTHHATRPQDVDAFAQAIMREAAAPVG
jgi:threonine aldolase